MKMTLLEIVSDILNDMDSDEVGSIDDTIESQQVAQIVKSTYFAMMSNRNWAHLKSALNLQASGDSALPTHVTIIDSVKELCFINYNAVKQGETKRDYKPVKWVEPDDFLRILNKRNSDETNVDIIQDPSGIELLVHNDVKPTYFTSFNDDVLVFDSYDSAVDDTLQSNKFQAQAYLMPTWSHVDDHTPDLPEEAFTALLEEAKSRAMIKLKQVQDIKAEQEASRQQRWLSRKDWRVEGGVRYPNYGRQGRKRGRDVTFDSNR